MSGYETIFTDISQELLNNNNYCEQKIIQNFNKLPELKIKINNIEITALIDSGAQVEAIQEQWFIDNYDKLGEVQILPLSNTCIKTAIGNKSKLIRQQTLLSVNIAGVVDDVNFFIVPKLSRHCILGINLLKAYKCILNFQEENIILNMYSPETDKYLQHTMELCAIDIQHSATIDEFQKTVREIETINEDLEINELSIKMDKQFISIIKQLPKLQGDDDKFKNIIKKVQENNSEEYKRRYLIRNNILYRKDKQQWKIYVPAGVKREMISDIHTKYGHGGIKRTTELFKEAFTADQLTRTTRDIIRNCDRCQRCKDNNRMLKGETTAIVPQGKGELLSLDYYGPLVTSTSGVRYILVMVDHFTKYVKLYALRRATTQATLRKLREYIQIQGKPLSVLTDNGTQFTSSGWISGLEELDIKARYTAIRNPCTNLAERINRQLGNLFRIYMRDAHTGWARQLKTIEACINESYHETIEMTPHQAHFGQPPIRSWTKYIDQDLIMPERDADTQEIYLKIKTKRQKEAEKVNRRMTLTEFQLGEKVLLRNTAISDAVNKIIAKFCDLYEGPYVIVRKFGRSTYELAHNGDLNRIRGRFNVRMIKKYYEGAT